MVAAVPGASVERTDGPLGRVVDRTRRACHVIVTGTWKKLGQTNMPPQIVIDRGLATLGWNEDFERRADGPNGGVFEVRRQGVLCIVTARWEEAPPNKPTLVVSDEYKVEAACSESS